ncbi:acyltransferase [Caballeronia sp. SBC2]|uniref:acyltransferase family protein n=1 Tax=Caballeronia sp. SBC2 TaxID=2705547 RepID=UPI0013E15908|nr:acyltransferase [Caballeronia sp. SBC2]QIE24838.1 Acyltransferase family protein [Caballeronia sp. SBC2]
MALTEQHGTKITFANQLRGFAVICVVITHYLGIYWFARPLVAQYILAPVAQSPTPSLVYHILPPTFNPGPFGVGLFFLISGFVIPFTLEKLGIIRFAVARILRIFPTYWSATAVMLFSVWLSGKYWGNHFSFNIHQIVTNLLLIHMQAFQPSIDLVNWTLAIEIMFYVIAILMSPFIKRRSAIALVSYSLAVLAFLTWAPVAWGLIHPGGITISIDATKYELMFTTFLFIGTLFNFAHRLSISVGTLIGATIAMFLSFCMMWQKTVLADQFWLVPANYGYALVVFSVCYAFRHRFRPSKILDFFADVSYPLYIIHSVTGYAIIRFSMVYGLGAYAAMATATAISIAVAYLLHIGVEKPTANLGKNLFRTKNSVHSDRRAVPAVPE